MSLPGIRELELEAGEALQALREMPAEPLSTRIDREINSHLTEDGRPLFTLPDVYEIENYRRIWTALEFSLDRGCIFMARDHAAFIIVVFRNSMETIIHHAEHQNWTEMIQHIKWIHRIVQPAADCKWRLPLIQDGLPPTMEEAVWMTVALCQQVIFVAARTPSETLEELAHWGEASLRSVVAHLLRRQPSEGGKVRIMSPAQFFKATIFNNRPALVALRHSHNNNNNDNNHNNHNRHHHHQSIISSPAIAPIREAPNSYPLADNGPRPLPDMSQSMEGEHPSGSDPTTVTDMDVDSPSDHDTRSSTITQEQPAPPAQALQMPAAPAGTDLLGQRGQPVLEKSADELRRAKRWLDPAMGMPAPVPCKRCANPKTKDHDKCWIPKPQYQAQHGPTCAYCRIQKAKCSFTPDADQEKLENSSGNSASVRGATAGTSAADASTAVSDNEEEQEGDGDDQQLSQEQEQDGPLEDSQEQIIPGGHSLAENSPEEQSPEELLPAQHSPAQHSQAEHSAV